MSNNFGLNISVDGDYDMQDNDQDMEVEDGMYGVSVQSETSSNFYGNGLRLLGLNAPTGGNRYATHKF